MKHFYLKYAFNIPDLISLYKLKDSSSIFSGILRLCMRKMAEIFIERA